MLQTDSHELDLTPNPAFLMILRTQVNREAQAKPCVTSGPTHARTQQKRARELPRGLGGHGGAGGVAARGLGLAPHRCASRHACKGRLGHTSLHGTLRASCRFSRGTVPGHRGSRPEAGRSASRGRGPSLVSAINPLDEASITTLLSGYPAGSARLFSGPRSSGDGEPGWQTCR